jgi:polyhydroxybutyrate depolymerase
VHGLLLAAALAMSPCATAPVAGDHPLTLTSGGLPRTTIVHVPPGLPAGRPAPLVVALHGYRGSGPQMERYSGFDPIADRAGFIVAYPSSYGTYWNSTAARDLPDDVAFLGALIKALERRFCVPRVFATGVSNGGGMVALIGCALSRQLTAIASVAGGYSHQPPCRPAAPISVLEIHGTADQVVPYFGPRRRPTSDGLPPFVNGWAARDRCRPRPTSTEIAPQTTSFTFTDCAGGVAVQHVRITGGRHQWPGANPPDPGPPATICASCTVWRFFASHMRESRR